MILSNVHIIGQQGLKDIQITGGLITTIAGAGDTETAGNIHFDNAIAFPGLINSHDHLDFNLFPQTGNSIYNNYTEWATDVQSKNKTSFDKVLQVPQALRTKWGLYKNLLNGFTTVVNHGKQLEIPEDLVTVLQNTHSLHSVMLEKKWKQQLNNPFAKKQPYVIHAGEGTDAQSKEEIDELLKWNLLKKELIAVHGVAMELRQAKQFKALVWCPASNYFLLNSTANIDQLKAETTILFGSDSTLSSSWNIWEHLRQARQTGRATDKELFDMVTVNPASVWNLKNSGKLSIGGRADIVIAKRKNAADEYDAFFSLNPEDMLMIIQNGHIKYCDQSVSAVIDKNEFDKIRIGNGIKYVRRGIRTVIEQIERIYPEGDLLKSINFA